jgi:restriction system protein
MSLHENVAAERTRRALAAMTWREFEELLGEYFRRRGFAVAERQRPGPDGSVDLLLTRHDEYYLVQCKHWRTVTVDVETVREFCGLMAARHAAGGFVVTLGSFSAEARKFAEGRDIGLINAEQLAAAIKVEAAQRH